MKSLFTLFVVAVFTLGAGNAAVDSGYKKLVHVIDGKNVDSANAVNADILNAGAVHTAHLPKNIKAAALNSVKSPSAMKDMASNRVQAKFLVTGVVAGAVGGAIWLGVACGGFCAFGGFLAGGAMGFAVGALALLVYYVWKD